ARAESRDVAEAAAALINATSKTEDPGAFRAMSECLPSVAGRTSPRDAARIAAMLTDAMSKTKNPYLLSALSLGLSPLAARMEPGEAARIRADAVEMLIAIVPELERELHDSVATFQVGAKLGRLSEGLSATAAGMGPGEAAKTAARLTGATRGLRSVI